MLPGLQQGPHPLTPQAPPPLYKVRLEQGRELPSLTSAGDKGSHTLFSMRPLIKPPFSLGLVWRHGLLNSLKIKNSPDRRLSLKLQGDTNRDSLVYPFSPQHPWPRWPMESPPTDSRRIITVPSLLGCCIKFFHACKALTMMMPGKQ